MQEMTEVSLLVQERAFTRWINATLLSKKMGATVADLACDLQDGVVLCTLLEALSGETLSSWNARPRTRGECEENVSAAMQWLKQSGVRLVAIGPEDIVDCKRKQAAALVWAVVNRFHIAGRRETGDDGSTRLELLKWVRQKIPEADVTNFSSGWRDGKALTALLNALRPGLVAGEVSGDAVLNVTLAMEAAEKQLGVPAILSALDMTADHDDELATMTYVSYFRAWENTNALATDSESSEQTVEEDTSAVVDQLQSELGTATEQRLKAEAEQKRLLELAAQQAEQIAALEKKLQQTDEEQKAMDSMAQEVSERLRGEAATREQASMMEQRIAKLTESLNQMEHDTTQAESELKRLLVQDREKSETVKGLQSQVATLQRELAQSEALMTAAKRHHEMCEKDRVSLRRLFEELTYESRRRERDVADEAKKLEGKLMALVDETVFVRKRVESERDAALSELTASRRAHAELEAGVAELRRALKAAETEMSIMTEAQRVHDEELDKSFHEEGLAKTQLKEQLKSVMQKENTVRQERDAALAKLKECEEEKAVLVKRVKTAEANVVAKESECKARLLARDEENTAKTQAMEKSCQKRLRRAERDAQQQIADVEEKTKNSLAEKENSAAKARRAATEAKAGEARAVELFEKEQASFATQLAERDKRGRSKMSWLLWAVWWAVLAMCLARIFFAPVFEF